MGGASATTDIHYEIRNPLALITLITLTYPVLLEVRRDATTWARTEAHRCRDLLLGLEPAAIANYYCVPAVLPRR